MAPQTDQPGTIGSDSSRTTGTSTYAPPAETQQQCRHQLVDLKAEIAATENMSQHIHLNTVPKTGNSKNK